MTIMGFYIDIFFIIFLIHYYLYLFCNLQKQIILTVARFTPIGPSVAVVVCFDHDTVVTDVVVD